jgi:fucose 4-O-acetylase-like acetyltransferase
MVHTLGTLYKTGVFAGDSASLEMAQRILFMYIMPVFFAISGYLFRPSKNLNRYLAGMYRKFLALGIPYVVFSVIYVVLQNFSSGDVHDKYTWADLGHILVQPVGYLWYLYAYFFILALFGLLTLLMKNKLILLGIYGVFFYLAISGFIGQIFAVTQTILWGAPFLLGYLIRDIKSGKVANFIGFSSLIMILILWFVQRAYAWNYDTNFITMENVAIKLLTIPVFFWFFFVLGNNEGHLQRLIQHFGEISLIIYLIHAPVVSVARVITLKMFSPNLTLDIISVFSIALITSLFGNWLSNKIRVVEFVFYPTHFLANIRNR